jgi:hypothetical protein
VGNGGPGLSTALPAPGPGGPGPHSPGPHSPGPRDSAPGGSGPSGPGPRPPRPLDITVEPFEPLRPDVLPALEAEAVDVGRFLGVEVGAVTVSGVDGR